MPLLLNIVLFVRQNAQLEPQKVVKHDVPDRHAVDNLVVRVPVGAVHRLHPRTADEGKNLVIPVNWRCSVQEVHVAAKQRPRKGVLFDGVAYLFVCCHQKKNIFKRQKSEDGPDNERVRREDAQEKRERRRCLGRCGGGGGGGRETKMERKKERETENETEIVWYQKPHNSDTSGWTCPAIASSRNGDNCFGRVRVQPPEQAFGVAPPCLSWILGGTNGSTFPTESMSDGFLVGLARELPRERGGGWVKRKSLVDLLTFFSSEPY